MDPNSAYQIPSNSVAAQAGLIPTTRGLAGNIVLGDVIVAVNDKPVSVHFRNFRFLSLYCLFIEILVLVIMLVI